MILLALLTLNTAPLTPELRFPNPEPGPIPESSPYPEYIDLTEPEPTYDDDYTENLCYQTQDPEDCD